MRGFNASSFAAAAALADADADAGNNDASSPADDGSRGRLRLANAITISYRDPWPHLYAASADVPSRERESF